MASPPRRAMRSGLTWSVGMRRMSQPRRRRSRRTHSYLEESDPEDVPGIPATDRVTRGAAAAGQPVVVATVVSPRRLRGQHRGYDRRAQSSA